MSFLSRKPTNEHSTKYKIKHGKEKDLCSAHHIIHISPTLRERASAFTSKGSITLEAALTASFFFLATLCLVYIFEIMVLQTTIKNALHAVGKEIAMEAYLNPIISTSKMERELVETIGVQRLERSIIVGGINGFDCSHSKKYWNTTIMDLSVRYKMEVPILLFRNPLIAKEETICIKGWTGHETEQTDAIENVMVYVTDYGIVYHKDMYCTYLELSIKMVSQEDVLNLRNQSGSIYKPCNSCKGAKDQEQKVYITDYGEHYHSSLECSGLNRNIYAISMTDVHGLGGCSKCVK